MVLNTIRIFDMVQKLSCENIMLQSDHLVLSKMWQLKMSPPWTPELDLLAYTPINAMFIDLYLDSECVTFISFAYLVVLSFIWRLLDRSGSSVLEFVKSVNHNVKQWLYILMQHLDFIEWHNNNKWLSFKWYSVWWMSRLTTVHV